LHLLHSIPRPELMILVRLWTATPRLHQRRVRVRLLAALAERSGFRPGNWEN
jgi:hypothetical protein